MTEDRRATALTDNVFPRWRMALIAVLALTAMSISAYLLTRTWTGAAIAGCGAGSSCNVVLASRWSSWLTIPASLLGVISYVALLAALASARFACGATLRSAAWTGLIALAVAIAGAALWFIALQAIVLRQYCGYCMTAHVLGLLAATVVVSAAPVRWRRRSKGAQRGVAVDRRVAGAAVTAGFAAVAALILGQVLYEPPATVVMLGTGEVLDTGPSADRRISLARGKIYLSPHGLPMLGSPDAEHIIAVVYDYTCSHCRITHEYLAEARKRYGDQLGILAVCVPYEMECNEQLTETEPQHRGACAYAKLSLAVWRAAPELFERFDAWMFGPSRPVPLEQAKQYAQSIVGAAALERAMADPWIDEQIHKNLGFQAMLGKTTAPLIIMAEGAIEGMPPSAEALFKVFEQHLGLKPIEPQ